MIRNKSVLFIFRILVGGLFIYAGVLKVADPIEFARNISNYRLVPHVIAFFTALVLPWIEILAGALLVSGVFRRTNALLIASMLVFFIVLVALTMVRGIDVDCGCFGTFSRKADWSLILEDAVMLFMVLQVALAGESGKPASAGLPREPRT
jgi:putative oxidoreductase